MNKEFTLKLLKLLSAIEAVAVIRKDTPDYIFDELVDVVNELTKMVLSNEPN